MNRFLDVTKSPGLFVCVGGYFAGSLVTMLYFTMAENSAKNREPFPRTSGQEAFYSVFWWAYLYQVAKCQTRRGRLRRNRRRRGFTVRLHHQAVLRHLPVARDLERGRDRSAEDGHDAAGARGERTHNGAPEDQ